MKCSWGMVFHGCSVRAHTPPGADQGHSVQFNSRGHPKAWQSICPTRGATPKRGSPYPQLEGPRQSVGVHIPNSRGHAKAWESISPTRGATPKRGSPYPQLEGPRQSAGVHIPNSRGHAKAWESISPTRGATPKQVRSKRKIRADAPMNLLKHPTSRTAAICPIVGREKECCFPWALGSGENGGRGPCSPTDRPPRFSPAIRMAKQCGA